MPPKIKSLIRLNYCGRLITITAPVVHSSLCPLSLQSDSTIPPVERQGAFPNLLTVPHDLLRPIGGDRSDSASSEPRPQKALHTSIPHVGTPLSHYLNKPRLACWRLRPHGTGKCHPSYSHPRSSASRTISWWQPRSAGHGPGQHNYSNS